MRARVLLFARFLAVLPVAATLPGCGGGDDGPPPPAYSLADLSGRWRYTIVYAGPTVATGATGWARGTLAIDANGVVTLETYADSGGTTTVPALPPVTYAIGPDGVVTATTTAFADAYGKLAAGKAFFVLTATQGTGASARVRISFYEKIVPGTTYGAADVASATFALHQLATGAAAGWMHARVVVGADRVYSVLGIEDSSGGTGDVVDQGSLSISSDGVVTSTASASFEGFLSADKQLLVGTQTTGPNAHALSLLVRSGGSFATSDLAGGWSYSNLASAVDGGGWARGTIAFTAAGTGTFGASSDSQGGTAVPPPVTLSVAADGATTDAQDPTFHGALTSSKDVLLATTTHEEGLYGVIVAVR